MTDTTKKSHNAYTAENITWLKGLEAVRHRPGMYIGDVGRLGLFVLCREVLDNATDEAMAGFANDIVVRLLPDNVVSISDNGRGIPVDIHESGRSALELVMTELHAGGKFDGGNYKVAAGLHGVGVSVVNALSNWVEVEVKRDGKLYKQRYERGIPAYGVTVVGKAQGTGTTVTYQADSSIFTTDELDIELITKRMRELSYLMPTCKFTLENHRVEPPTVEVYQNKGGLAAFCEHLNKNKTPLHRHAIHFSRKTDKVEVEVAVQYNESYHDTIITFGNTVHNVHGGLHESGFKTGLTRAINTYARKKNLLKDKDSNLQGEDVREGLAAVISVKVPDPIFDSQAKVRLTGPQFVEGAVNSIVYEGLVEYLDENPNTGQRIVQKCITAAQAREAAKKAAELVKRKNALESDSLPGKLADCSEKDPRECEIYLVEGDSAGGCFSGETLVALTDGRHLSFKELVAEQAEGKEHFCYTIRRDGQIGLQRAINARVTKRNAEVVRVTLDNGETITCTPDHRFMLRDGSYKPAAELTSDDSLMPLYRKLSDMADPGITINGYEMTWD
ncbi:MAG: ATP-binding protein, partial [Armatimonadota bacterium]|nr:ATP-binding protein [Armatimonadota bacterium]